VTKIKIKNNFISAIAKVIYPHKAFEVFLFLGRNQFKKNKKKKLIPLWEEWE
jgi:hypothetical protein